MSRTNDTCAVINGEEIKEHWFVNDVYRKVNELYGINFEMAVPDAVELYNRVLEFGIKPFRIIMENSYREGDNYIVQHEFLVQDPDGFAPYGLHDLLYGIPKRTMRNN